MSDKKLENIYNLPQDVFEDLIMVLREADADLMGMQQRFDYDIEETKEDRASARKTRNHLRKIHKKLTGKFLQP